MNFKNIKRENIISDTVLRVHKMCSFFGIVIFSAGGANEKSPGAVDERSAVASLAFILTSYS